MRYLCGGSIRNELSGLSPVSDFSLCSGDDNLKAQGCHQEIQFLNKFVDGRPIDP